MILLSWNNKVAEVAFVDFKSADDVLCREIHFLRDSVNAKLTQLSAQLVAA